MNVVIIDTSISNIKSLQSSLSFLGVEYKVTNQIDKMKNVSHIILPGVGNFDKAMHKLRELNLINHLHDLVMIKKIPFLGICLGMQLIFNTSEEGTNKGLSFLQGNIKILKKKNNYKVPNVGYNKIFGYKEINFFDNLTNNNFYFVHSYALFSDPGLENIAYSMHSDKFIAAFQHQNIYGTQFHPEKSQSGGLKLLVNFLKS